MTNTQIKQSYLQRFTLNLSKDVLKRSENKEFKIVGRDQEIKQVLNSLIRATKNAPTLLGDAGVGKTAVVEGVAYAIATKQPYVAQRLLGKEVLTLQLGAMMSDHFIKDFSELLKEMAEQSDRYILFIDELHTIMGAGATGGSLDAGNLLKPPLARGDFSFIGATTLDEFERDIESDEALQRRFQKIEIDEPDDQTAQAIITGIADKYERVHNVSYTPEALAAAINLSKRYIFDRYLPDKAIDVIDIAGAQAESIGQKVIDVPDIAQAIHQITGISANTITKDNTQRALELPKILKRRVFGQKRAIDSVVKVIQTHVVGVGDPRQNTIGTFLFAGLPGTGKTELAKATAEAMFDSPKNFLRFDMSEFSQNNQVSVFQDRLVSAVRKRPYSLILLDEIEKGSELIPNILLQVFQDGILTGSNQKTANFKDAIIIMTSNEGQDLIKISDKYDELPSDQVTKKDRPFLRNLIRTLDTIFRPEFINRIDEIITFNSLNKKAIEGIAQRSLKEVMSQIKESTSCIVSYDHSVIEFIADKGFDRNAGARPVKKVIRDNVQAPFAKIWLAKQEEMVKKHIRLEIKGEAGTGLKDSRKVIFKKVGN